MYTRANTFGGWVGVDLDGTLAQHTPGSTCETIGEPVAAMQARVVRWLAAGVAVKIVTARVSSNNDPVFVHEQTKLVQQWCHKHLGQMLKVTAEKDFRMLALWDDRAITIGTNTGEILTRGEDK